MNDNNNNSRSITIITTVTNSDISISNIKNGNQFPTSEKYLGGHILEMVDNGDHIDNRLTQANAILVNIKFNNVFTYRIQFKLARLLICNLIRPVIVFGPTFFNYSDKQNERLNIFQNTLMREALSLDMKASSSFSRVILGVSNIQIWVDYLNLVNYYRIRIELTEYTNYLIYQ